MVMPEKPLGFPLGGKWREAPIGVNTARFVQREKHITKADYLSTVGFVFLRAGIRFTVGYAPEHLTDRISF